MANSISNKNFTNYIQIPQQISEIELTTICTSQAHELEDNESKYFPTSHDEEKHENNTVQYTSPANIQCKTNIDDTFRMHMVRHIEIINTRKNIIYYNKALENGFNQTLKTYNNNLFNQTGFTCTKFNGGYCYAGNNPAYAIRQLLNDKPLIIECRQAWYLCIFLATLDTLGDNEFNRYITNIMSESGGKFKLNFESVTHLPLSINNLIQQNTNPCQNYENNAEFQIGDSVYVAKPNGTGFHPTSCYNGHNIICVGHNKLGEALFLGFENERTKPYTLAQIDLRLEKEYKKNLTYGDLLTIYLRRESDEPIQQCAYTYRQIYTLLEIDPNFWEEIHKAMTGNEFQFLALERSKVKMPLLPPNRSRLITHTRFSFITSI